MLKIKNQKSKILKLFGRGSRRGFSLAAAVSPESPGGSELAQFVPHHVFRHEQLDELAAIVDQERLPDKIGNNGAIARPGFQWFLVAFALLLIHFRQQALVHVWSLF